MVQDFSGRITANLAGVERELESEVESEDMTDMLQSCDKTSVDRELPLMDEQRKWRLEMDSSLLQKGEPWKRRLQAIQDNGKSVVHVWQAIATMNAISRALLAYTAVSGKPHLRKIPDMDSAAALWIKLMHGDVYAFKETAMAVFKTEQLFYPFLIIAFCVSVLLLFVWIETSNEYHGFDCHLDPTSGWKDPICGKRGTERSQRKAVTGTQYRPVVLKYEQILIMLVILICTFFMAVLCIYWNDRWLTFGLSLKVFAPYLHLSCITMMVLLSYPVAFYLVTLEQEAAQVAIGLPFFFILLCLCVVPWGYYSPCLVEKNKLGPKPDLFGHRGAPMLAPENTIMSFEKAVENRAFGLETDIYISIDGVPFLMHDHDLRRTTNIMEVMPNSSRIQSSFFYWSFLSTLNAGKWFVDSWRQPFHNMKPLSEADKEKARKQMIPKLSDLLKIAKQAKKYVIFDLNGPPPKHPFRNTYVRHVVKVILDTKIEQHLIYWLPGFDRDYVKQKAPGFQQVGRLSPIEELRRENISIINVDYKRLFHNGLRDYKAADITINLYIVNKPWVFSLAWCSRIHSVTTDNIELLRQIDYPYYFMSPGELLKNRDICDFGDVSFSLLSHRSYCELGNVPLTKASHMAKSRLKVDEGRNSKVT
ncbi:glycerophosphodiester phosphodiesterase domain-containing protein 4-like [Molossus nigricans]